MVKKIDAYGSIIFSCANESFYKTSGEFVSLVHHYSEVYMIRFNQARNTITIMRDYSERKK